MDGLEGLYRDPNGPAYQRPEARVGPPLEYVAEKLGAALRDLHRAERVARDRDELATARAIRPAFLHALVAYLALANMLAVAEDPDALVTRLLDHTDEEFDAWLWRVEQEGSVTG